MKNAKMIWMSLALLALVLGTGCKKDAKKGEGKEEAKPAEGAATDKPAGDKPADPAAEAPAAEKPDAAMCEKVVAKQLELETDAQMKATMTASKQMMVDACTSGMSKAQAECAAGAADTSAFGACMLK